MTAPPERLSREQIAEIAKRRKDTTAIVAILCGAVSCFIGASGVWSLWAGTLILGMIVIVLGVIIGLS